MYGFFPITPYLPNGCLKRFFEEENFDSHY
jgi:hypothetical protein